MKIIFWNYIYGIIFHIKKLIQNIANKVFTLIGLTDTFHLDISYLQNNFYCYVRPSYLIDQYDPENKEQFIMPYYKKFKMMHKFY